MAFDTVQRLTRETNTHWRAIGPIWLVLAGLTVWGISRAKGTMARQLTRLQATLPDWIDLTEESVRFDGPGADTHLRPWGDFRGWFEGQRVILLEWSEGGAPVILPIGDLSDAARQPVRQFLQSRLAPPKGSS